MKIKNIAQSEPLKLDELVTVSEGQIVSRTLAQNGHVSLTLFAFAKGEEISTHASGGDALVTVFEGKAKITVGGKEFIVKGGESILMPANVSHALEAIEDFKMSLTVVF